MKYFSLVWSAMFRSKTRTILTILSVVAAFMLFGLLDSVRVAFNGGGSVAGADRLVVASRLSITQMLPYSLLRKIQDTPGVKKVAYAMWFGGIYRDQHNSFTNFSVSPEYFDTYSEYIVDPTQLKAWQNDRTGAIVGESLAKRFEWQVGDTIPLQATAFLQKDGSNAWPLTLRGTFRLADSKRNNEENQLFFHWNYFDEASRYGTGQVGWYMVTLNDVSHATRVASAIDAISLNSSHETKTQTERAFNQSFAKQFVDVGLVVTAIMTAVFFTLLLLAGNTMSQAVRERISELAILKTLGFTNGGVLGLVLLESCFLTALGGLMGLAAAAAIIPALEAMSGGILRLPSIAGETWLIGLALMIGIGVVVGTLPAIRAMRLKIVDALAGR